ncbi:MAG: GTP pyrophosphokinase [Bacteroidetes bacterium ADurb.Bin217]|nr:MAG: GTP pyrophosphokinase [Bacteroidetes bacterium ADurb.Bin217]
MVLTKEYIVEIAKPYIKERDIPYIYSAYERALQHLTIEQLQSLLQLAQVAIQEIGLGGKAIVSLFLYPLYIQNNISESNILNDYGEKVFGIITGLQRVQKIDTSKSKIHSENFIKLILSQADDVRVILILIAKKLYELRSIHEFAETEQIRISEEISSLYAPIAHRLGLYAIKTEMEEMSMKYLHNEMYKTIAKKLAEKKTQRDEYIQKFIEPIQKALESKELQFEIKGRPKSIYSIWNKLKKSNVSFEHIYDLFAIRIIVNSKLEDEKSDCWNVYSIVSDIYRPNPNRLRDWISSPKHSGYESLHTTVLGPENRWVEVQIRTKRMDEIAEKGYAAHWKYKEGASAVGSVSWLARIRSILENPEEESLEEDKNSRMQLYTDEIFIYTPQGDLRRLKAQATVLDFAYDIHGDIGNTCTGAKVNGKVVPIKHVLHNGDKIEILTAKSQTPKQDWLSFVVTSKARQRIKKYLKDLEYKEAEAGKEIIVRKFTQNKVKFGDDNVHKLLKFYGVKSALDLYVAASQNKLDISLLKDFFEDLNKNESEKKPITIDSQEFKEKLHKRLNAEHDNLLIIDNSVDNVDYKLSPCCNPIKGDEIFGFLSAGGGIKVHRLNCPNAMNMLEKYPYRIIKTRWTNSQSNKEFNVGIRVIGNDDLSIINNITQIISRESNIKMRSINIYSNDGNFEGRLSLYITDNHHLHKLLEKIKSIKGVHTAERFDI